MSRQKESGPSDAEGDETRIDGVLFERRPTGEAAPVVFDSPHSGSDYPDDFRSKVPPERLRLAEDMYVDALFAGAPACSAVLLGALFPRSYIDPNRTLSDLDPDLVRGAWPGTLTPSAETALGVGLIWRNEPTGGPMYDRKLSVTEVEARIDGYYRRYHDRLRAALDDAYRRHGAVWHIDCHSMPSTSGPLSPEGANVARPQFSLGDRDGTTCDSAFTAFVRKTIEGLGYQCTVNDPYKGVELVRAYSDPPGNRHSLQIEISRALYMDETTFSKTEGFAALKADLDRLIQAIVDHARKNCPA